MCVSSNGFGAGGWVWVSLYKKVWERMERERVGLTVEKGFQGSGDCQWCGEVGGDRGEGGGVERRNV